MAEPFISGDAKWLLGEIDKRIGSSEETTAAQYQGLKSQLDLVLKEAQKTNGRVTKLEVLMPRVLLAVFGAGPLIIAAVAYLYVMHVR